MDKDRADYEGAQALRIDIENAQHIKEVMRREAETSAVKLVLLAQSMRLADHADMEDMATLQNLASDSMEIQNRIAKRPVSDKPRG